MPMQDMETEQSNPLQCYACEGVLLPERAIRLLNGVCVLRYFCMGCGSRSYAVQMGSAVRVYPSTNLETVTGTSEVSA